MRAQVSVTRFTISKVCIFFFIKGPSPLIIPAMHPRYCLCSTGPLKSKNQSQSNSIIGAKKNIDTTDKVPEQGNKENISQKIGTESANSLKKHNSDKIEQLLDIRSLKQRHFWAMDVNRNLKFLLLGGRITLFPLKMSSRKC